MRSRLSSLHPFALTLGLLVCALVVGLSVSNLSAAPEPAPRVTSPTAATAPLFAKAGEDDCPVSDTIACGATVSASLTAQDCTDDQNRALDVWTFSGQAGQTITATLEPGGFEGDLELYDPSFEDYAEMEGQFPGQTVTLQSTLNASSNLWRLVVKTDDTGVNGPYDLTLECEGDGGGDPPPPPPPGSGYFTDPAYPDFEFRVRISAAGTTLTGVREPNCLPETVCVSGALPGRSEVFLRIIGPRPNGFLWPTIVRFTPSQVVVNVRQTSTGQMQTYTLGAVPPGSEDLSGRQDRNGFLPQ